MSPFVIFVVTNPFSLPVGTKSFPLYTLSEEVLVSNHNSPRIGTVGAEVPAEFSNNLTRFSLLSSPQLE